MNLFNYRKVLTIAKLKTWAPCVATDGITLGFVHLSSAEKYSWKIVEYQQNDDKTKFKLN